MQALNNKFYLRLSGFPDDYISCANDSVHYFNSKMILRNGCPVLVSAKDIKAGEEVLYNYTQDSSSNTMMWRKLKVSGY